jgi:hypothetical protein
MRLRQSKSMNIFLQRRQIHLVEAFLIGIALQKVEGGRPIMQ